MRHRVDRRKLGLPSDQRRALLNNLARQLIRHGYVQTTEGRAKELRRIVEPLVTLAKRDTVDARRRARRVLVGHGASSPGYRKVGLTAEQLAERCLINGEDLVKHLFDVVGPRHKDRPGGYTRITKLGQRRGDGAPTAVIELVD
ncbi:MAG: 50S ribosomal protein L17 [Armatimonadota bacterium]|nr:50S ribosomal protein L17 [Armatimonadota bacterium]